MKNRINENANDYNYFEQIISDCINELRHDKETYCFKLSQLEQIQSVIPCKAVYDGVYILTVA